MNDSIHVEYGFYLYFFPTCAIKPQETFIRYIAQVQDFYLVI